MLIDTHVHIFPIQMCKNREKFFDNEPEFKLLYDSPHSKMIDAADVITMMDKYQVDWSVICGFPWRNPDFARLNNDYVIESVMKYPDRLKGLACFDAHWEGAAEEALRCIKAGMSGVGELAFYLEGINNQALSALEPIMQVLKESDNLPCMIHTNEPIGHVYPGKSPLTIEQTYALIKKFPENKIILAHWGGGIFFYHLMKKEVRQALHNVWFDTAASPFLYDHHIYKVADDTGVIDKVLFGTDYPLLPPDRYVKEIADSGIHQKGRRKILHENAALLYRLV